MTLNSKIYVLLYFSSEISSYTNVMLNVIFYFTCQQKYFVVLKDKKANVIKLSKEKGSVYSLSDEILQKTKEHTCRLQRVTRGERKTFLSFIFSRVESCFNVPVILLDF